MEFLLLDTYSLDRDACVRFVTYLVDYSSSSNSKLVTMNDIFYGSVLLGGISYAGWLFLKAFQSERVFPILAWAVLSGYIITIILLAIHIFSIIKSQLFH